MKKPAIKIIMTGLCFLLTISLAHAVCYPGLDCPDDLPKKDNSIPAPRTSNQEWQLIDHYQVKDGLAKDITTGLIWMRCSIGQTWNGSNCTGNATKVKWEQAMGIPKNIDYAGYSDWRLPTKDELKSIVYCSSGQIKTNSEGMTSCDGEYIKPTIAQAVFPNTSTSNWFWSASPVADNGGNYAWIVGFYGGNGDWYGKDSYGFVRLVRAGQ
jgi:hypothetical protein